MGVVFRVHHPGLDAEYALKVLRTDLCSARDLARFQREIELVAAASDHPHVVGIHTAAEEQGRIYYVMDLVEGEDLQRRVGRGPLPPRQAARYVRDLAGAVAHLHARGIVHRDVKPANVIVDDQDRARLADFGLARAFTDDQNRLTRTGELIGTPYYMAPEQAEGKQAGPEADVYALGMVLYTLLAGRPAVEGATALEVVEQIRRGGHVPLAEGAPGVPAALERICAGAMAMDPAQRPSPQALAAELDAFLGGAGAGPTAGQAAQRRLAALGAGLILLVALGVSAWLLLRGGAPPAPDLSAAVAAGEQAWESAGEALLAGQPDPGLLETLAARRAALEAADPASGAALPPKLPALRGRLLAREGELALLLGRLELARQRLQQAERLVAEEHGPGLRELKRFQLAALRGGLEALDPRPDDDYGPQDALRDLGRALEQQPGREALLSWRIRVAVAAGRGAEALPDLEAHPHPDTLPAAVRCAVLLDAGRLEQALALVKQVQDPALVARVHYAAGMPALRQNDLARARLHLSAAVAALPDDPRAAEARRLAHQLLREAGQWQRGTDPRVLGNAIRREVEAAALVRGLEPDFQLPRERVDAIYGALGEVASTLQQACIQIVYDLIQVVPGDVSLYKVFAALAVDWGLPQPQRDVALIQQGLALAKDPADRRLLLEQLTRALYTAQRLEDLASLAKQVLADSQLDPELQAFVCGRLGDLYRYRGDLEQARAWLDRTRALDPQSFDLWILEYAFHRVRFDKDGRQEDHDQALACARHVVEHYPAGSWDDWLPDVCVWLMLQEEAAGRFAAAARALGLLLRFHPEALRWEPRRLGLLLRIDPLPAGEVQTGVDHLPELIAGQAAELEEYAARETDAARAEGMRRRAEALRQLRTAPLAALAKEGAWQPLASRLADLETRLARIQDTQ